ncbi:MAG: hypothetical protein JW965_00980 [Bacteroidales bacterium]|nr:hypothetical protein [Bacteroidales bacterium]
MKITDIFSVWETSNRESYDNLDLSPERIRAIIKPRMNRSLLPVKINIVTYLIVQFASIIMLSYNLSLFLNNSTLLILTTVMLISASVFFFYGLNTIYRINRTDYVFRDLLESIQKKLKLLRINCEIWLWICSASIIILILALNMMIDSVEGTFRINHISLVTAIIVIVFFFTYGVNKLSLSRVINEYRDYYSDLQNNALDRVTARDKWVRKYRVWIIIGLAIIFILLLFAFIKGIMVSHQLGV